MIKLKSKLIFFFIITGISFIFLIPNNAFATTIVQNHTNSVIGIAGNVIAENYTGLPAGQTIHSLAVKINKTGTGDFFPIDNYTSSTVGLGAVVLVENFTGLPAGATITNMEIKIGVLGTGSVRGKIFDSKSGGNLLGQSGSITPGGTGFLEIPIAATVPANGTIYAGFEISSASTEVYRSVGAGTAYLMNHVYGTGPTTYTYDTTNGALYYIKLTYHGPDPQVRVKIYTAKAGGVLLGQSGAVNITSTGVLTVPVTATIPANGTVYGAFEMLNPNTLFYRSVLAGLAYTEFHTFGAGPNIFTYNFSNSALYYQELTFNNSTGTPKVNNTLSGSAINNIAAITQCYKITDTEAFLTQEKLYNFTSQLLQTKNFSPPQALPINTTTCPYTFYQPYLYNSSFSVVSTFNSTVSNIHNATAFNVTANNFTPGNFTIGNLDITQTNPNTLPIKYQRVDVNANNTDLLVSYPNTFNLTCNLSYKFALTNHTYSNLPSSIVSGNRLQSIFNFTNPGNEVIYVKCSDVITGTNATYILTQTNFPIVQQIKNFRNGTYGTHGELGALDLITFLIIIIGMIGFNRINEAAGVIFVIIVTGVAAYFGIIQWPTIVGAGLAVVVLVSITSHKKLFGV